MNLSTYISSLSLVLVICLTLNVPSSVAKEIPLDSMSLQQLESGIKHCNNADSLFKLRTQKVRYMSLHEFDPKLTDALCDSLLKLPIANSLVDQTIMLYKVKARLYFTKLNDLNKAQIYTEKALALLSNQHETITNKKEKIKLRSNLATIFGALGYIEQQQNICFELIPLAQELKDTVNLANIYRNIAIIYVNREGDENVRKALTYLKLFDQTSALLPNSEEDIAKVNELYCSIYYKLRDIPNLRQSIANFKKKEKLLAATSPYLSALYWSEGALASLENNHLSAIEHFSKAMISAQNANYLITYNNALSGRINSSLSLKRWNQAANDLKTYKKSVFEMNNNDHILLYYKLTSSFYQLQGDYRNAYMNLERYMQISDSINTYQLSNKLHSLERQYSFDQKENQIKLLRIENDRTNILLYKNKIISYFLIFVILIIIIALFVYARSRDREKLLQRNQIKLLRLEMETQKQNSTIDHMRLMKSIESKERLRIAKDLHDGLSGLLSGIKIAIQKLQHKYNNPELVEKFEELSVNIDDTKDELKRIVYSLSPKIVERYGVIEGIRQYCRKLEQPSLSIKFQPIDFNDKIHLDNQIMMYRLVQEILNNVIKHANASQVLVQIQSLDDKCLITVEDNGIGFDSSPNIHHGGIGLKSIQERVKALKGSIEIESSASEGTSIYICCYPY